MAKKLEELTEKQQKTLEFIKKFLNKKEFAPTILEICKRFKLTSKSSGWSRVNYLVKKNYLYRKRYCRRGISLKKVE